MSMNLSQAQLGQNCKRLKRRVNLTRGGYLEILFFIVVAVFGTFFTLLVADPKVYDQNNLGIETFGLFILYIVVVALAAYNLEIKNQRLLSKSELIAYGGMIELILEDTVKEAALMSKTKPTGQPHPTSHLRSNIMVVSCDEKSLHIATSHNMLNEAEKALVWSRSHGVCGIAWDENRQIIADLTIPPQPHGADWRYPTTYHQELTKHLKSVICTPIYRPNSREVIAILNVDSTESIAVTEFENDPMLRMMHDQAKLLQEPLYNYLVNYQN